MSLLVSGLLRSMLICHEDITESRKTEMGSVTHPYGHRIEELVPMRKAIREAIVMHGGKILEEPVVQFQARTISNIGNPAHAAEALHMTRHTTIGALANGTDIIERSSFLINLNAIPEKYSTAISDVPVANNHRWHKQVLRAGSFQDILPALLKNDSYDKAIPLSTTTIAVNEEKEARLLNEEACYERQALMRTVSNKIIF